MPHSSHHMQTYRDFNNVWVEFCDWCGADDNKLEKECSRRYAVDNGHHAMLKQSNVNAIKQVDKEPKQD